MTTPAPRRARRRLQALILRWEATLESERADQLLPWMLAGVLFVLWFGLAYARARTLDAGTDLAAALQARWLILHGHAPQLTVTGDHLLAQHLPLGFYPTAWITRVLPAMPTIVGIQALSLALGIVPLWWMARRLGDLRVGAALAIAAAYALSPTLNNLVLADFHPVAVAVAPLLAATYFALQSRWAPFALMAVLAVVWSAELGLVIAGIGILLFTRGERRPGGWAFLAGLAWTVVAIVVLEPRYGSTGFIAPGAFQGYGETAFSIVWGMAWHPFEVLHDLLAEDNVRLIVTLLAPLLFLPVLAPRFLIPALPLQALYLIADVPHVGVEVGLPLTIYAFVAATFALTRMGRKGVERVIVDRRVLLALVAAALGFFAISANSSPYRHPWEWRHEDAVDAARRAAAATIGSGVSVRAAAATLPLVAERKSAYELPSTWSSQAERAVADVDRVIVDDASLDWDATDDTIFASDITALSFRVTFQREGVTVYSRVGT